jgi:hypothetical protein
LFSLHLQPIGLILQYANNNSVKRPPSSHQTNMVIPFEIFTITKHPAHCLIGLHPAYNAPFHWAQDVYMPLPCASTMSTG